VANTLPLLSPLLLLPHFLLHSLPRQQRDSLTPRLLPWCSPRPPLARPSDLLAEICNRSNCHNPRHHSNSMVAAISR
jgi:hypothetical protein